MSSETELSKDGDDGAAAAAAPRDKKTRLLIGSAGAVLLLLGGGGGAYMMFGGKPAAAAEDHGAKGHGGGGAGSESNQPLDVPPILVNLRSPDGGAHFLKVHVMLVPGARSTVEDLKAKLPILMDAYQPFLRELRPEDLSGSAAVYRIKEELVLRSASAIGVDRVKDVLVQDLIQQ